MTVAPKKRSRAPQPRRNMIKIWAKGENKEEFSLAEPSDSPIRTMLTRIAADRVMQGHDKESMSETMRRLVTEAYVEVRDRQKQE